jgi:hypothetical protein
MKTKQLQWFAWGSALVVTVLAVVAWGQSFSWNFSILNTYLLFPVLGLIAFSLMWSHYVTAAVRQYFKIDRKVVEEYFETTTVLVLGAILLHPGLLAYQLWRDGLGLPPGSELNYLPNSKDFYILIAMFSLFVFLAYELRRWYHEKPWWKYLQYLSDLAIVLIYIHGLNVGSQLQQGWFQIIWYFYGVTLAVALGYTHHHKLTAKSTKTTEKA